MEYTNFGLIKKRGEIAGQHKAAPKAPGQAISDGARIVVATL